MRRTANHNRGRGPEPAPFRKNVPRLSASSHLLGMAPAILFPLGDFRGPVIDAAGTRYFEPDGVIFCDLACLCLS
jgi:hypothetical protein